MVQYGILSLLLGLGLIAAIVLSCNPDTTCARTSCAAGTCIVPLGWTVAEVLLPVLGIVLVVCGTWLGRKRTVSPSA